MDDIQALVSERAKTHGDFNDHARITQNIKSCVHNESGWRRLSLTQMEAIDMIAHKIGRILAGNPNHHDHWDDIAGYARITSERIPQKKMQD